MPFGKGDNLPGPMAVSPTSLQDTLVTSFEATNQETSLAINAAKNKAYDDYISVLRENGIEAPSSPYKRNLDEFSENETDAIARWHRAVDSLIPPGSPLQIKNHDDLMDDAEASREAVRQKRAKATLGESGFVSGTTAFVGSMGGATADPLVLGTLPLGAPWATGVLRTVLVEAAIGGASEVGVQAIFQTQRQDIGEEASLGEAFTNIGLAAAGAGVIGGAVKGAVKGGGALKDYLSRQKEILEASRSLPPELRTTEVRTAEDIIEREIQQAENNPFDETAEGLAEHRQRVQQAADQLVTDGPVDLPEPINVVRAGEAPEGVIVREVSETDAPDAVTGAIVYGRSVREALDKSQSGEDIIADPIPQMDEPPLPPGERIITNPEEEIEAMNATVDEEVNRMLEEAPDTPVFLGDKDIREVVSIREAVARLDNETDDLDVIKVCGAFQ